MFVYYDPQIVKLLTEERVREAGEAHRHSARRATARQSWFSGWIGRLFARQPALSACSC